MGVMTMPIASTKLVRTKTRASVVVLQNHRAFGPCAVDTLALDGITLADLPPAGLRPGALRLVFTASDGSIWLWEGIFRPEIVPTGGWRIAFRDLSFDRDAVLRRIIVGEVDRRCRPLVMVLDCRQLHQARLRRDLGRLGRDVVFCDDPEEVFEALHEASDRPGPILVDHSFVKVHGLRTLTLLRERWPDRRVFLVHGQGSLPRSELRRLRPLVHGSLEVPWTPTSLRRALGIAVRNAPFAAESSPEGREWTRLGWSAAGPTPVEHLGLGVDLELSEDGFQVVPRGVRADEEARGDLRKA